MDNIKIEEEEEKKLTTKCMCVCVGGGDCLVFKVLEQRQGMTVYRDQPGGLEKTDVVSVWMKKDRGWEKHSGEEKSWREGFIG